MQYGRIYEGKFGDSEKQETAAKEYMKKYADEFSPTQVDNYASRAAGTLNLLRMDNLSGSHLNPTRRRILNDFVTHKDAGT